MSEIKLKPCPFCGGEDIYETYSQECSLGTKNPEIFCNSCKAILSIEDDSPYMTCDEDYAYRKAKTKEAWNTRAERHGYWKQATPFVDTVECSECGYQWPEPAMASKYCPDCGALMLMDEGASEK